MQLTTFSRIKKLKSVHVNIEASYIEYVTQYIDSKDFIYKNQDISEKVYSCQTYVTKIVKIKTLLSFWILIFLYTPVLID